MIIQKLLSLHMDNNVPDVNGHKEKTNIQILQTYNI